MPHITNEEHVRRLRWRAVRLANEMLGSDDELIQKCRVMDGLLNELGVDHEPAFVTFAGVVSETDHLPLTVAPELLEPAYRARSLDEARQAAALYGQSIREACRSVLDAFRPELLDASPDQGLTWFGLTWLSPWEPVAERAAELNTELARELPAAHVLSGVDVEALARRADRDDVLYRLADGSGRLAVVHLTYSVESDAARPATEFVDSATKWEERMQRDHDEYES